MRAHQTTPRSIPPPFANTADGGDRTLNACLRERASRLPDKTVYTFLDEHGNTAAQLTYAQLHKRAECIARVLRAQAPAASRVLLLFWPGLDFAEALFGCLYAGMVAVPAYPPEPARIDRTIARLRTIATDATPAVVLTSSSILALAKPLLAFAPDFARLPWLAVDTLCAGNPSTDMPAECSPHDLAIIQYTSGSTTRPKGVMVSHENILANMRMIQTRALQDEHRIVMSWLPTYHDLGLMGGIFLPVTLGGSAILMSPLDFLRRPALWLSTISRYRATDTFVPNFALDIAVRKIVGAERDTLDLSCLKVCFIGAEPVRHASVERFLGAFSPHGLARDSLGPSYGLAEAVVSVSGGPVGESPRYVFVDALALADHRFVTVDATHPHAQVLVSSGRPMTGLDVRIVHALTLQPAQAGEVGEVWIRGPSVAPGYWQCDKETRAVFQARMAGETEESWLRSGDLGCFAEGHIYITGRIKDLLVIRGKNHYPQDIELTVERSHQRVRPGAAIAFAIEQDNTEQLVVVAEVDIRLLYDDAEKQVALEQIVAAIRNALHTEHALQAHDIVLIKARTIDKTSSGKLARHACRKRFSDGKLETEYRWTAATTPSAVSSDTAHLHPSHHIEQQQDISGRIATEIARLTGTDPLTLTPETRLADRGLDSLAGMELLGYIEQTLGVTLSITTLLSVTTLAELMAQIGQLEQKSTLHVPNGADLPVTPAGIEQGPGRCSLTLRSWDVPAPLFCMGGLGGTASYLSHLAQAFGGHRSCIAFRAPGIDGIEPPLGSVEELARRYIDEMRAIQPRGPYAIAGHSFGGLVAYDMALQLSEMGERVASLCLLDTSYAEPVEPADGDDEVMALFELGYMYRRLTGEEREPDMITPLSSLPAEQQRDLLRQQLGIASTADHMLTVYRASHAAMLRYRPRPYAGPVCLFVSERGLPSQATHPGRRLHFHFGEAALGWDRLCPALQIIKVSGDHFTLVMPPHAQHLADALQRTVENTTHMHIGLDRLLPARGRHAQGRALDITADGIRFDPHHPDFIEDPYPFMHQLREQTPVFQDAMANWWVTRHADVSTGLRNKSFSVDSRRLDDKHRDFAEGSAKPSLLSHWFRQQEDTPLARLYNHIMPFVDPPAHTRLRKAFAPLFSPEAVQRLARAIDERVHELIADMRLQRNPDLIHGLALPLPVSVISSIYDVPREDSPFIAQWARDINIEFDAVSQQVLERANRSTENLTRYVSEHVARLRQTTRQSSHSLFNAEEALRNGLSMDELTGNIIMSYFAGFETTTSAIGNGTLALLRHPDQMALLRQNPTLIHNATEELLRYDCPVRYTTRFALDDVNLGGRRIRRGDTVMFMLGSANRDRLAFHDPDRLDLQRDAKHHVTFSHGLHYCLGASLVRLELQRVFLALALQQFSLLPGSLIWRDSLNFRSLDRFQIAWSN